MSSELFLVLAYRNLPKYKIIFIMYCLWQETWLKEPLRDFCFPTFFHLLCFSDDIYHTLTDGQTKQFAEGTQ